MKGIILAAGRGSRMQELTLNVPKCFLEINSKPLIEIQLNQLRKAGIKNIAIVTGYKNELLSKYNQKLIHNENWANTQMVSSLIKAKDWIGDDSFIISYSDIFYDSDAISKIIKRKDELAILYDLNWLDLWKKRFINPLDDAETFKVDENDFVTEIGNKTDDIKEIQGQYMGILLFSASGWKKTLNILKDIELKEIQKLDMTSLLQLIILKNKIKIKAIPFEGSWGEVDNKKDLEFYNSEFKDFFI